MKKNQDKKKLLFLTADKNLSAEIDSSLELKKFDIYKGKSYSEALALFKKHSADIAFIDIENMPAQEMDLVNYIKTRSPATEIVILTTMNELDNATYSLHYGASFYLMKPVNGENMKYIIEKLSARITRNTELFEFEHRVLSDLMAGSEAMQKILKLSMKIAPTASTVLIGGETGTGKEFFAKIIHRMSQRIEGKFIPVNCGGMPDTLFESELFGYKKGAFTGADRDKPGLVEEAHMGTLFLDEVGELSQNAQVKLLRFLQEHTYRRVGDPTLRTVNVRVIAATNKNLFQKVADGEFREDLYYRLNVFYFYLPPLRERKETIPNLIRLFVPRNNTLLGKNINRISKAAEVILAEYDYPGNVRELENIIEHAMIMAETSEITEKDLPEFMFKDRLRLTAPGERPSLTTPSGSAKLLTLDEVERKHIEYALNLLDHNYTETAEKLGISRSTLWRKIKTHHLEKE
jgi:two-component system nitrogen regulation response regulator GlnG/two-component system response regulator HydG